MITQLTVLQEYQQRKSMNAVKFDSVTIYFSDLVDFIQMVEESTPAEVAAYLRMLEKLLSVMLLDGDIPEFILQDV